MLPKIWFRSAWIAVALGAAALQAAPTGLPTSREDAPYGAYGSVYKEGARPYQALLDAQENRLYAHIHGAGVDSAVAQAAELYELEHEMVRVHEAISDAPEEALTPFEREALLYRSMQIFRAIRGQSERIFEIMIRELDRALPGPNGLQVPVYPPSGNGAELLYSPNYRSEKPLTAEEKQAFYESKLAEYLRSGDSLESLHVLDEAFVAGVPSGKSLEYVERPDGAVWVTAGKAGHLLLAEGKPVRSAGQIVFIKSKAGQVTGLLVTNASGTYKPDPHAAQLLANRLCAELLKLPESRAVVSRGEPLSLQNLKLLMKAHGESKERIQQAADALKQRVEQIRRFRAEPKPQKRISRAS